MRRRIDSSVDNAIWGYTTLLVGNPAYTTGLTLLPSLLFSVRVEELD
jgi:hypothetical protein